MICSRKTCIQVEPVGIGICESLRNQETIGDGLCGLLLAGLCKHPKEYKWSSRNQLGRCEMVDETELFDTIDIDEIIREKSEEVRVEYLAPKIGRRLAMPDAEALSKIKAISGVKSASEFQSMERTAQGEALIEAIKQGVSQRQLARLTGLGRTVIIRLCKNTE